MDTRQRSAIIDCCIYILEAEPPTLVALVIRWWKRRLERDIPVYRGRI